MKKLPRIVFLVIAILSVLLGVIFYSGGESGTVEVGGDSIGIPTFIDPLMYWVYILMGLIIIFTLYNVFSQYTIKFKTDAKSAIKSLISVGILVIIMIVSFVIGSGEKMEIIGYEGTDNQGFWAQFTDMCMFTAYTLFAIAILAIIGTSVYKMIKK